MKSIALFKKDWQQELRTKYSINSLLMFVIVTVSLLLFSVGEESLSPFIISGFFWVVVFFVAMMGLSRAFVAEEEKGTSLVLQLIISPSAIFVGKFLFNFVLISILVPIIIILFILFFNSFVIYNNLFFLLTIFLGNIGISTTSTIIAAIVAKANYKGKLYPVLSFPLLLPLILLLTEITRQAIEGRTLIQNFAEVGILICYDVIMLVGSYLLFEYIWKD